MAVESYKIECHHIGVLRWAGTREHADEIAEQVRQDVQTIGSPPVTVTPVEEDTLWHFVLPAGSMDSMGEHDWSGEVVTGRWTPEFGTWSLCEDGGACWNQGHADNETDALVAMIESTGDANPERVS